MVKLGIAGLAADWDSHYLPAIKRLGRRVTVRAVHDRIFNRAQQWAESLPKARPLDGLLALADHHEVDAIIVLGIDWRIRSLLPQLCMRHKPLLLAGHLDASFLELEHLHATAILTGTTLMPELPWRYTPATNRLQELLATCLGDIQHIELRLAAGHNGSNQAARFEEADFAAAIDWSSFILRTRPHAVSIEAATADAMRVSLQFPPGPRSQQPVCVHIENQPLPATAGGETAQPSPPASRSTQPPQPPGRNGFHSLEIAVQCQSGAAQLHTSSRVCWSLHDRHEPVEESLESERPSIDVQLDHFCRRAVGGLIPVADLSDVYRSQSILQSLLGIRSTGQSVCLPPH